MSSDEYSSEDDKFSINLVLIYYRISDTLYSDLYVNGLIKNDSLIREAEQEIFKETTFKIMRNCQVIKKLLILEKTNINKVIMQDNKLRKITKFSQRGCLSKEYLRNIKYYKINNKTKRLVKSLLKTKRSVNDDEAWQYDHYSDDDEKTINEVDKLTKLEKSYKYNDEKDFSIVVYNVEKQKREEFEGSVFKEDPKYTTPKLSHEQLEMLQRNRPMSQILNVKHELDESLSNDSTDDPQLSDAINEIIKQNKVIVSSKEINDLGETASRNINILIKSGFLEYGSFIVYRDRAILLKPLCHAYGDFITGRDRSYISRDSRYQYSTGISRICKKDILNFAI